MATIGWYFGQGFGSLLLPYLVTYFVIKLRRGHELRIDHRTAALWFAASLVLMSGFHALAEMLGAHGGMTDVLLAVPVPLLVSWFAVMVAATPRVNAPTPSPAEEMRAIRPK